MEAVFHAPMPPAVLDLGSLFGIKSAKPPPNFEKGQRWEPPTQHELHHKKGNMREERKVATWDEEDSIWSFFSPPPDPIAVSKTSFNALLKQLQTKERLAKNDLFDVLAFLSSPQNQLEAQLTLLLVQWLGSRKTLDAEIWPAVADSIGLRARNSEIHVDEVQSILLYFLHNQRSGSQAISSFTQLPDDFHHVFRDVAAETIHLYPDKIEAASQISRWLDCLVPAEYSDHRDHQFTELYELLADYFDPSDFAVHFGKMPRTTMSRVILKHWIPRYTLDSIQRKQRVWRMLYANFRKHQSGYGNYAPNDLVACLARWRLPYVKLLYENFFIYFATQPASTIKNLALNLVKRSPMLFVPRDLGVKLVDRLLDEGQTLDAARIFMAVPGIPLTACPELPVKAVQEGTVRDLMLWGILHRTVGEDIVPRHKRLNRRTAPQPAHIEVVEQTALAWAKATHLNTRTAFRRVWECYRFLRDRRVPLSPLMSQALVEAGIARAMRERSSLGIRQAHFILDMVQRIEGSEKADTLNREVSEYWEQQKRESRPSSTRNKEDQSNYPRRRRWIWTSHSQRRWLPPMTYYRTMLARDLAAKARPRFRRLTGLETSNTVTARPFELSDHNPIVGYAVTDRLQEVTPRARDRQ